MGSHSVCLCVCLFRKKSPVFFTFQQKPSQAPYTYENAKVSFPFLAPVLNLALKTKHICISEDPVITKWCHLLCFCSKMMTNVGGNGGELVNQSKHRGFRCFLDGMVIYQAFLMVFLEWEGSQHAQNVQICFVFKARMRHVADQ